MKIYATGHKKILSVVICSLVAIALISVLIKASRPRPNQAQHSSDSTPTISTSPTPTLDPLTIAAIRGRNYSGGKINLEQDLGSQNGYNSSIISYISDGYRVFALKSTPLGSAPAGGWPIVILNHGYIEPSSYQTNGPEYDQFISSLARAGFVVIKPDYRGHGRSEGQPEGGHFSPAYTYDLLNLIASIKQTPGVNGGRIGLLGHSMGAHVALRAAVSTKDIKALAVMSGVVGSMDDIFYRWPHSPAPLDQPRPIVQGKRLELIKKYGEPKDNPTFWSSVSAINFVNQFIGSVQIHHSTNDSMVPLLFSEHLESALKNANKSVELYSYPGNDHQLTASRALVLRHLINFFKVNL